MLESRMIRRFKRKSSSKSMIRNVKLHCTLVSCRKRGWKKTGHARELTSFWWENVVAVASLLRVLARISLWRKQVIGYHLQMNADLRHQILGILSFSDRERTLPPSTEISVLTFVMRKRKEGFESQHGKSVTFAMVETAWTVAIFPSNALLMLATLRPTAQEVQPLSLITSYALNRKKGQL